MCMKIVEYLEAECPGCKTTQEFRFVRLGRMDHESLSRQIEFECPSCNRSNFIDEDRYRELPRMHLHG